MKIIYTCPYVPVEWVAAFGFEPRSIAGADGFEDVAVGRIEGLCAYTKACANEVLADGDCAGAVFTTVCDQMRRVYDIVADGGGCETFLMNVPSTWKSADSKKLYVDEMGRLGRWLSRLGGRSPSNELLAETMIRYEEMRKTRSAVKSDGAIPLAIVGGPMAASDCDIFGIIERAGGSVVLDATEGSGLGEWGSFDRDRLADDALGELARAYFEDYPAVWKRPNSQFFEWLGRCCRERNVGGVIFHRIVWCDIWHAELGRIRESVGLPVLDLDVSDDTRATSERTINRIEAFLETLK